jgi:2-oxoglutarate dehydrogenase E2 component (dihydrolipoamide succinyltransferase)
MELIVPTLGESITEATVSKWLKKVGDSFEADEPLVEIETDKITVEVPAPSAGSISEIKVEEGADVNIGGVLALLGDKKTTNGSSEKVQTKESPIEAPKAEKVSTPPSTNQDNTKLSPSVKKLIAENNLSVDKISSSRSDGRLTK